MQAIVTGSSGERGNAICTKLINANFTVIGIDCNEASFEDNNYHHIKYDLGSLTSIEEMEKINLLITNALNSLKKNKISLLVNNAAVQNLGNINEIKINELQHTFNVNLFAPLFLIQLLMKKFDPDHGSVINISSIHAKLTKPRFIEYATSKAALSALTRNIAVDVGSKFRINAIEPAAIETKMLLDGFEGSQKANLLKKLKRVHPQNRIGNPNEIAELVLSIFSGDLKFLHGECISIDGGISSRLFDPE